MHQQKFKPILFSTPMIQAILADNKTMTRRIIKPPISKWLIDQNLNTPYARATALYAKYQIGDILWVRETFGYSNDGRLHYAADVCSPKYDNPINGWKPSIFMPKEVCRLFLQVTHVKPELLTSISEEDALKEGVKVLVPGERYLDYQQPDKYFCTTARNSFISLWQKINGMGNSNPFVWAYTFKKLDGRPEGFL